MSLLEKYITGYTSLKLDEKKDRIKDILLLKNPIPDAFYILEIDGYEKSIRRQAINVLCDIALKPSHAKTIFRQFTPEYAGQILSIDDPKIRKAAARLCGIANKKEYNIPLIAAIDKEETMYVLDSLILALGYTDYSKRSLDYLKSYTPKSIEKKHLNNETLAIKKAISSLTRMERISSVDLNNMPVILTYCSELQSALSSEMDDYGLSYTKTDIIKNSLLVKPKNYVDVFGLRCFFEALIYLGEYDDDNDELLVKQILSRADLLFGLDNYSFRLDVQYLNAKKKSEKIDKLIKMIESDSRFKSSTSNYQFEIRLIYKYGQVVATAKIPYLDDRFKYRKNTIPASIHPVIAASIIRTLRPYLKEDAKVLDPFVGTGTLLYERDYILPCEELVGVDIKKDTIFLAKTNFFKLDIPISFLVSNILDANLDQTFDEIICNMPFGRRVANHDKNEELYEGFVSLLDKLLDIGGHAFLYTNEKLLLKGHLHYKDNFEMIDEIIIEAGGLYPSLFILKKIK